MAACLRDRVLPTPTQLRDLADDCEALHRAVTTWGDRPYIELGDLVRAIAILSLIDTAESMARALRHAAHLIEAEDAS